MKIEMRSLDSIRPYENNPRNNDNAVDAVANSIKQFGFQQPIVVDKDGVIVVGHTRYRAARKLGLTEVPVKIANELAEEEIKAYRLADNMTNEIAEWDFEMLTSELLECEIDMTQFGFEIINIEPDPDEIVDDEFSNEVETRAMTGDLWALGKHRLKCGDATSPEDVASLVGGAEIDLVVTDPPYNVAVENSQGMTIENDNIAETDFDFLLEESFSRMFEVMKCGAPFYVWHASTTQRNFENALNKAGLFIRQQLIWVKNQFVLSRQDYQWRHEPCFYGWKEGAAHYFVDDRTQDTVVEEKRPSFASMKKSELVQFCEMMFRDKDCSTIMHEDKPAFNSDHPTMKPLKLISRLILNSSRQGENVLDLFGGSGSTLMACEQLNRKCYTMELDPHYVDVIIARWEKLTGETAVLLNGEGNE